MKCTAELKERKNNSQRPETNARRRTAPRARTVSSRDDRGPCAWLGRAFTPVRGSVPRQDYDAMIELIEQFWQQTSKQDLRRETLSVGESKIGKSDREGSRYNVSCPWLLMEGGKTEGKSLRIFNYKPALKMVPAWNLV